MPPINIIENAHRTSCQNFDTCESAAFCGIGETTCARKLLAVVNDGTIPVEEKFREMAEVVRIGLIP